MLQEEIVRRNEQLNSALGQLDSVRESSAIQKRRMCDAIHSMLRDLSDVGGQYANAVKVSNGVFA